MLFGNLQSFLTNPQLAIQLGFTLIFASSIGFRAGAVVCGLLHNKYRLSTKNQAPIIISGTEAQYESIKALLFTIFFNYIVIAASPLLFPFYYYSVAITGLIGYYFESKILNN